MTTALHSETSPATQPGGMPAAEILRRLAISRDAAAWGALLEQHGPELLRACRRILRDESLAEDAVQETLLKLRDRAGQFRGTGPDPERAACDWLRRTACTTALQLLRTRARERRRGMEHGSRTNTTRQDAQANAQASAHENAARVRHELDRLPEHERLPLVLHFYGEMDYAQVAVTLGCPIGTAKARVHRGVEKLRQRLALLGLVLAVSQVGELLRGSSVLAAESAAPLPAGQIQAWRGLLESSRLPSLPDYHPPTGGSSIMLKLGTLAAALLLAILLFVAGTRSNGADQPPEVPAPATAHREAAKAKPAPPAAPAPSDRPAETPARPAAAPATGPVTPPTAAESKALADSNNAFALDFFAKLRVKEKENLFLSPYSISSALAMTYAGARGATETEMAQALRFTLPQERLHAAMGALVADLNAETRNGKPRGFALSVANSLWGQQGYPFEAEFLKLTKENYDSGLTGVDFVKAPEDARLAINKWVEGKTQYRIKDLIPEGRITRNARLVLVNAIYFKSDWLSPFEAERTRPEPFHLDALRQVKTELMHQTGNFKYYEQDKQFQLLELPYLNRELSMLVLLPATVDGLAGLENTLTAGNMAKWTAAMKQEEVRVALPKFNLSWGTEDLVPALKDLGMSLAFDNRQADFNGIAETRELFIGMVLHKAFVEVREKGTEAAAATAVIAEATGIPPLKPEPKVFRADRPFVFAIRDNASGSILFLGRLANPKP